jgi:hypothetical protein
VSIAPGTRLRFGGDVVEVVAIDGVRVTLRPSRGERQHRTDLAALAADVTYRRLSQTTPTNSSPIIFADLFSEE